MGDKDGSDHGGPYPSARVALQGALNVGGPAASCIGCSPLILRKRGNLNASVRGGCTMYVWGCTDQEEGRSAGRADQSWSVSV